MCQWNRLLFALGIITLSLVGTWASRLTLGITESVLTKEVGETVVVKCKPDKEDAVVTDVSWTIDGAPIPQGQEHRRRVEEEPWNNCDTCKMLVIDQVEVSDEGEYECKGVVDGSPRSASFTLFAQRVIKVINAPTTQSFQEGMDALVKCEVSYEPDQPIVEWFDNGQGKISNDGEKVFASDKGLTIKNISRTDEKTYTCQARTTGSGGLAIERIPISVVVNYPPKFAVREKAIKSWIGATVALHCKAEAKPAAEYMWLVGPDVLHLKDWERETGKVFEVMTNATDKSSTLKFRVDQLKDFTYYYCNAENKVSIESPNAKPDEQKIHLLEVHPPDQPVDVKEDQVSSNTVRLQVTRPLNDGGIALTGYKVKYRERSEQQEGMWSAAKAYPVGDTVKIEHLNPSTQYEFEVSAENAAGISGALSVIVRTTAGPGGSTQAAGSLAASALLLAAFTLTACW
ncbi:PREDICTED: neural cell adhesion molecule 1-like [Priapulus caudatus]|uniref:Neural cell adhesion molecule 1-like n=1 Tax=Priapulus caudatus TaxID=37621 RepID=A0ABM1F332_PRICU|nr:PREDICTED: neural cell adhesion molecule 1-like [Priapulus caudatus]